MRSLLFVVGLFFFLTGCQNEENPVQEENVLTSPRDTVGYMPRHAIRTYGTCADPSDYRCTKAEIDYILITTGVDDPIRKRINRSILEQLSGDSTTLESFLDHFLAEYDEYVHSDFEFMDEEPGWFYHGALKMVLNDTRVLTLSHLEHIFTGGAHGNYETEYWHYNTRTGYPIKFSDLVLPDTKEQLKDLGEVYFRRDLHLQGNGSLNESFGFSFPEDQFYLPESYALMPEGLTFIFGTYEIASYADGELHFTIPYNALADVAKPGSVLEKLVLEPPYDPNRPSEPTL